MPPTDKPKSTGRNARLLKTLKELRNASSPALDEEPMPPETGTPEVPPPTEEDPGQPSQEALGLYAPDTETQRRLKRAKARRSVDDDLEALWPSRPQGM